MSPWAKRHWRTISGAADAPSHIVFLGEGRYDFHESVNTSHPSVGQSILYAVKAESRYGTYYVCAYRPESPRGFSSWPSLVSGRCCALQEAARLARKLETRKGFPWT